MSQLCAVNNSLSIFYILSWKESKCFLLFFKGQFAHYEIGQGPLNL